MNPKKKKLRHKIARDFLRQNELPHKFHIYMRREMSMLDVQSWLPLCYYLENNLL